MDQQYLTTLEIIMNAGVDRGDRTGTGTRSIFGHTLKFNLEYGFPAITTKKLAFKSVVSELLWFLEGADDERRLAEIHYDKPREELVDKTTIWTANANDQGKNLGYENTDLVKKLGPIYGVQWRNWNGVDQVKEVIDKIKTNPNDRRLIISAWNVEKIPEMALPPCHCFYQFYVANGKLSCQVYQRSVDAPLGLPFNLSSYALLTHMIAQVCNLEVGEFSHVSGDLHIYHNQFDGVKEQLTREPYPLPTLWLNPDVKDIDSFTMNDIKLENYKSHPKIVFPFAT